MFTSTMTSSRPIKVQSYAEVTYSYVENHTHFIDLLINISLDNIYFIVSFDVTSIFTKVLVTEVLAIIKQNHFISLNLSLPQLYGDQRYKHLEGANGLPFLAVLSNLYMEDLEHILNNTKASLVN